MSVAACPARRVMAHAGLEWRLTVRNGEQLLLSAVIPVVVLIGLSLSSVLADDRAAAVGMAAPGAIALAVLSAAFTGNAIATGFERREGVLRSLAVTPLRRRGLVAGKTVAVLALIGLQVVLIAALAGVLGWRPSLAGLPAALLLIVLGAAAFSAWGLLLAGTLRAEAVLAVANAVHLLLLIGGAVVIPADRYPDALGAVLVLLPPGALGEGLRTALGDGSLPVGPIAVLALWTLVGGVLAGRLIRWD